MADLQDPSTFYRTDVTVNLSDLPDIPPPTLHTMSIEAESVGKQKKIGRFRHFEILCDEPPRLGGEDEYPQPLTYLVAGVAFLTAHPGGAVRVHAQENNWQRQMPLRV